MRDSKTIRLGGISFKRMISAKEIGEKVASMAQQIKADVGDQDTPLFICVLKGAFIFASDLVREYGGNCELDFIRVSSYQGSVSSEIIKTFPGMDFDIIRGRKVIIVEDIVDTGLTMDYLLDFLRKYEPKSLSVATLCFKKSRLVKDVKIDYCCFDIPDTFIVGYGFDYDGLYRNLPAIYIKETNN